MQLIYCLFLEQKKDTKSKKIGITEHRLLVM